MQNRDSSSQTTARSFAVLTFLLLAAAYCVLYVLPPPYMTIVSISFSTMALESGIVMLRALNA